MLRNPSGRYISGKYKAEKMPKLRAVRVAENLYTPSHREGIAFVNTNTNKVVVPTSYVDALKLKKQMKEKQ